MLARLWVGCLVAALLVPAAGDAATPGQRAQQHRWQDAVIQEVPAAVATRCTDCPTDVVVRCQTRGRGLIELSLVVAAVANGRAQATKQIRLTFGPHSERRRALTVRQAAGFVPVLQLAVDDPLLARLQGGGVLKINFYGQRRFVGLSGAAGPIARVRTACRPAGAPVRGRHCTWSTVIACRHERVAAGAVTADIKGAIVRATPGGYCAALASPDLGVAQARAERYGGYVERSCLP